MTPNIAVPVKQYAQRSQSQWKSKRIIVAQDKQSLYSR